MKMKTVKSLFTTTSMTVGFCLALNVWLYHLLNLPGFNLLTPYDWYLYPGLTRLPQEKHAVIGLLFYIALGVFFWSLQLLFRHGKFGLTWQNFLHLFLSVLVFSNFNYLAPIRLLTESDLFGITNYEGGIWAYYSSFSQHLIYLVFIIPLYFILAAYLIIWLANYFYYRHQIKKLNQKIAVSSHKK